MAKVAFGIKVSPDVAKLFESLYDRLGGPKFRIIEAAIEVFAALPKEAQYILKSQDDEDRKVVLSRLRAMNLKSGKGKSA